MRWMLVMLAGCWATPDPVPPVIAKVSLPCGVARVDELVTFGKPVGTCTVVEMGPFYEVFEAGKRVFRSGEAKPTVSFDPRIPGPHGIRTGMLGSEIQVKLPRYRWVSCARFGDVTECTFTIPGHPSTCEAPRDPGAVEPISVYFDTEGFVEPETSVAIGVVLEMPC